MTRLHELNFFIKLGVAFIIMLAAWFAPDWRFGVPLALVCLVLLWGLRVPGLRGYIKGAALLTGMVMVSWMINLWLQGLSTPEALSVAAAMASRSQWQRSMFFNAAGLACRGGDGRQAGDDNGRLLFRHGNKLAGRNIGGGKRRAPTLHCHSRSIAHLRRHSDAARRFRAHCGCPAFSRHGD